MSSDDYNAGKDLFKAGGQLNYDDPVWTRRGYEAAREDHNRYLEALFPPIDTLFPSPPPSPQELSTNTRSDYTPSPPRILSPEEQEEEKRNISRAIAISIYLATIPLLTYCFYKNGILATGISTCLGLCAAALCPPFRNDKLLQFKKCGIGIAASTLLGSPIATTISAIDSHFDIKHRDETYTEAVRLNESLIVATSPNNTCHLDKGSIVYAKPKDIFDIEDSNGDDKKYKTPNSREILVPRDTCPAVSYPKAQHRYLTVEALPIEPQEKRPTIVVTRQVVITCISTTPPTTAPVHTLKACFIKPGTMLKLHSIHRNGVTDTWKARVFLPDFKEMEWLYRDSMWSSDTPSQKLTSFDLAEGYYRWPKDPAYPRVTPVTMRLPAAPTIR